jgi:hypothetical protein
MIKRRTFITGLGSTAAWPVVGWAQQGDRVRRASPTAAWLAELPITADDDFKNFTVPFLQGLRWSEIGRQEAEDRAVIPLACTAALYSRAAAAALYSRAAASPSRFARRMSRSASIMPDAIHEPRKSPNAHGG